LAPRRPTCLRKGKGPEVSTEQAHSPILRHACGGDIDRLYPPDTVFEDCPVCSTLLGREAGAVRELIEGYAELRVCLSPNEYLDPRLPVVLIRRLDTALARVRGEL